MPQMRGSISGTSNNPKKNRSKESEKTASANVNVKENASKESEIATSANVNVKQESIELEQPERGPNILSAETFTHGGVRKAKFEPKVPTRRSKKVAPVKSELGSGGEADLPGELLKLVKQSQEDAAARSARRPDIRAPTRVAFGSGTSTAGRAAAAFSKGGGTGIRGGGGGSGGGGGGERKSSKTLDGFINEQLMPDKQEEKLKVVQGWDLSKYYPVTLPLQKPGSRELDAEDQCGELDENAIPAADELGLMEPSDDDRYIFFQLPSFLPFTKPGSVGSTKPTENTISNGPSRSVKKADHIGPSTWLEDLPPGEMGKLLVYRSGAVKLQLGGISFEAVAGSKCVFAQELVAVNAASQHCCFLGDITDKAVLVPAINEFLEGGSNEQKR